ncbi:LacI family DNA-binding transcriptional regulator [Tessaracoccus sp. MC1756]|nr:LacI family DNA-binding transcriptional regulator [Tessaracoccus sp. MC1756]
MSQSTVSNVINNPVRVSEATAARVTAAIRALNYVPNDAARALRTHDSRAVGILLSETTGPFYTAVIHGADQVLLRNHFASLVASSYMDEKSTLRLLHLFAAQRIRGLIVNPVSAKIGPLLQLVERGLPVVFIDADIHRDDICSVSVDHTVGARLVVEHLKALGRRRMVFARGREELPSILLRLTEARRVCSELGLEFEEMITSDYFVTGGLEAGAILGSRPAARMPDAVFCANDVYAMGLLTSLAQRGIQVPSQVAVVGYDDTDLAQVGRVPLTTIRQPAARIGDQAAALLLSEMTEPGEHAHETVRYYPELIIRGSTVG